MFRNDIAGSSESSEYIDVYNFYGDLATAPSPEECISSCRYPGIISSFAWSFEIKVDPR